MVYVLGVLLSFKAIILLAKMIGRGMGAVSGIGQG